MYKTSLRVATVVAACSAMWAGTALAAVSAEKAAELGKSLTPIGAEKAASKDGLVPEWTPHAIAGPKKGYFPTNPKIEAEKPLYTITAKNMAKYQDMLSQGAQYMLKTFADYKLNVYPSHRTVNYPDFIAKATKVNATNCKLEGTDYPYGCKLGFPYPIPTNGAQAIWNHRVKWRGGDIKRTNDQLIVDPDGKYQETHIIEDVAFMYSNPEKAVPLTKDRPQFLNYMSHILSPPRVAGEILLVHESGGTGANGRQAWLYAPALKRIRRAPTVCCDNPYEGTDGLQFYDQVDMYNGTLERFTWKLVGKKQMIIPYDNFKIVKAKYDDIAAPGHINQDLPRYEVHRVWVIEATLAPGMRHTYAKKVLYMDEDSWNVVMIDNYDGNGQLICYQEGMHVPYYNIGAATTTPEIIYHLDSGRYFVTALQGEGTPFNTAIDYPEGFFDPELVARRASN